MIILLTALVGVSLVVARIALTPQKRTVPVRKTK